MKKEITIHFNKRYLLLIVVLIIGFACIWCYPSKNSLITDPPPETLKEKIKDKVFDIVKERAKEKVKDGAKDVGDKVAESIKQGKAKVESAYEKTKEMGRDAKEKVVGNS